MVAIANGSGRMDGLAHQRTRMRRRTRSMLATLALATALTSLVACGGRADGGNPGNIGGETTTTQTTVVGG